MLRVPIDQAQPGMKLAMQVRHPRTGHRLLNEDFELDEHLIAKLAELGVHEIWIQYPNTDQIKEYLSPAVVEQHGRMASMIAAAFNEVHQGAHAQLDFPRYRQTLRDLIEALVGEPTSAAYILEMGGTAGSDLRHAAEVCFLSVLLGLKLQGYLVVQRKRLPPSHARNVISLGLGAMIHDIGMTLIDEEVRRRYEKTRDEQDEAWRRHVIVGHHLVSGSISPAAAGTVLHHHQHYDGSGFPVREDEEGRLRGLIGEEIHVFARIVCLANHFDRLRRPADGTIRPRVSVMRQMLASELSQRFDPVVLATLPLVVPAYPPGSIVTLNDGQRALVRHWHPDSPCQPTVSPLDDQGLPVLDAHGEPVSIDLRQRPELLVVEQDGQDVSHDNFRLIAPLDEFTPAA
jgi:HD-GYP domain-containing protein (c-di-GMP phosphodiesterase class II)